MPMNSLVEIKKPVQKELDEFNVKFKSSFKSNIPLLNIITRYVLKRKGKQIRPILVFLSANIFGKTTESTHVAASLIELLHTATLIHDDVVDDSHYRRNRFSINALWKSKVAVLLGDYLLAKGLLIAVDNNEFELLKIVSNAVKEMSEGELLQIQKSRNNNITEEEYFNIIRKKTATLIGACTSCGAESIKSEKIIVEKMKLFGEYIGIAFQIKDDLLDYQINGSTGKPVGNDLKNNKFTLPLIYAIERSGNTEKRKILRKIRKADNKNNIQEIIGFINEKKGIEYAIEKMNEHKQKALDILNEFPQNDYARSMASLVDFITKRNK